MAENQPFSFYTKILKKLTALKNGGELKDEEERRGGQTAASKGMGDLYQFQVINEDFARKPNPPNPLLLKTRKQISKKHEDFRKGRRRPKN